MTLESYGKMITNLVNGKRVLLPKHIGIQLENLLCFFSEINFTEEYLYSSTDTEYYRFRLQNSLIIDLSFFKRGFQINIFNNKESIIFVHEYSNKMWSRTAISYDPNLKHDQSTHYVESDISPILTSLLDDIRHTWENYK
jgi:hypothetical protein